MKTKECADDDVVKRIIEDQEIHQSDFSHNRADKSAGATIKVILNKTQVLGNGKC